MAASVRPEVQAAIRDARRTLHKHKVALRSDPSYARLFAIATRTATPADYETAFPQRYQETWTEHLANVPIYAAGACVGLTSDPASMCVAHPPDHDPPSEYHDPIFQLANPDNTDPAVVEVRRTMSADDHVMVGLLAALNGCADRRRLRRDFWAKVGGLWEPTNPALRPSHLTVISVESARRWFEGEAARAIDASPFAGQSTLTNNQLAQAIEDYPHWGFERPAFATAIRSCVKASRPWGIVDAQLWPAGIGPMPTKAMRRAGMVL